MFKKIFILTLFGLLHFTSLYSQTPPYYHYTSSDGLASSTVYDMIQDVDGFIWFGTLNGLSKFDGKKFKTFRMEDGLNSNAITCLHEGEQGEIYIGNYEKGINILRNAKIENFRSEIKKTKFNTIHLVGTKENIYSYSNVYGITILDKNRISDLDINIRTYPVSVNRLGKLSNDQIIALTTNGVYKLVNSELLKLNIYGLPDKEFYSFSLCTDGSYLLGSNESIYRIKNNRVIKKYNISFRNEKIFFILSDSRNNIWFSLFGKGFYTIPNGSDKIISIGAKLGIVNTQVDSFLEDAEGNIWVATFGKGVYCLNNLYIQNYSDIDGLNNNNVNSIEKDKSGRLIFGTINGVNIFSNGLIEHLKYSSGKDVAGYITSVKTFDNRIYVNLSSTKPENDSISFKGMNFRLIFYQSLCKTSSGYYLSGNVGNTIVVEKEFASNNAPMRSYVFGDSAHSNRVNVIREDSLRNIWVGTNLGICKLSNLKIKDGNVVWEKTFFKDSPILNDKIYSIHQDKKNNIWVAGEKGVASINLEKYSVTDFRNISGYNLSSSTAIVADNKNRIWIGNLKGLFLLDGGSVKYLNTQTGLPSDEVLSLYYDNEKNFLYVGTSNGISFLDMNLFDSFYPTIPIVKMIGVKAGDSIYTNYNNLIFKPDQHDVYIDFKALNFSSPGSVKYKYKLNDDEWTTTDYDFLNLISLKSGIYNLQIMAKAQNTEWGKPYILSFRVLPRFSETIWFYIGIISVFVFIALYIVIWRLRIRNKKMVKELNLTERINDLKHQALSAMMNPHFIFNALNSVQYLINSQRNEEANNYIAMMAKLIRKNLDTAGSGFILLSEEINRLNLYLDLEKLRFQESFSYEIITGSDVNTCFIMIPNMIIQPFVENSLWHGIINSGNKGVLTVSFYYEEVDIDSIVTKSLIIKVTDNGIGIKEASKKKDEDHISKGIEIIEERLKLLSSKMQLPKPIMLEDLSSRGNNSHGTEVIISLPPPLYKIINPESDSFSSLTD